MARGSGRPDHGYDLAFVERAPLPPHERSWRHPSEIAADTRREITAEQPSRSTRTAALLGGTATIVLFGVAVFSLTPTADGPTATGSTPVQGLSSAALAGPVTLPAASIPPGAGVGPAPIGPLVTEVGDTGIAVLPSRTVIELLAHRSAGRPLRLGPRIDLVGRSSPAPSAPGTIVVTLQDGSSTMASVLDPGDGDGLATVWLEQPPRVGYQLATTAPDPNDTVIVVGHDTVAVEWRHLESGDGAEELDDAGVPDGAAVLDASGHLVGIYAEANPPDGGRLIVIGNVVDATTTQD